MSAARLLAAGAKALCAGGIFIGDTMVVINVAVFWPGPNLAATDAARPHGVFAFHDPRNHVEIVDVLLDVEISG